MFAKLWNWFVRKPPKESPQIGFSFDGRTITADAAPAHKTSVRLEDIREIGVETTDTGPFAEDVFWLINRDRDDLRIPQGSPVFEQLTGAFGSFEGFDWQSFAEAMTSADRRYFLCWQRPHKSA